MKVEEPASPEQEEKAPCPERAERAEQAGKAPFTERDEKAEKAPFLERAERAEKAPFLERDERAEKAPLSRPHGKKRGPETDPNPNAMLAAAALLPVDSNGRRKKYKAWQRELCQAIFQYFPEQPLKIRHDSILKQMAIELQKVQGPAVDLTDLTGVEAIRRVLPAGTDLGRGNTAVYRAVLNFLSSRSTVE